MAADESVSTRNGFGNGLLREAEKREDFVVMDADLSKSTRGSWFRDEYPDQWFNMGISEQDMFATAAGIASTGRPVFANTFAIFAQRGFEQIRQQIARPKRNVTVVGSHAGIITGQDGASAQAIEDISTYRGLPNMRIISPADAVEANRYVSVLANDEDPAYLRLVRQDIPQFYKGTDYEPEVGCGDILQDGKDVTLIAHGAMVCEALKAAEILDDEDIGARVINMSSIKPLDREMVLEAAKDTGAIVTAEDHNVVGGLGSAVAKALSEERSARVARVGVDDEFGLTGTPDELYDHFGLTGSDIADEATELI